MSDAKEPKFADSEAQDLFSRMIQAVPDAMKEMVKPMLLNLSAQKAGGGPITVAALKEMIGDFPNRRSPHSDKWQPRRRVSILLPLRR